MSRLSRAAKRVEGGIQLAGDWAQEKVGRRLMAKRAGTVDDSLAGPVAHTAVSGGPPGLTIAVAGIAPFTVQYVGREVTVLINGAGVVLRRGREALRRRTYAGTAERATVVYELRPTWYRAATFRRGSDVLARVRRRRRSRRVTWQAQASPDEVAIAHALIAHCGVGAPGFIVNLIGELDIV